MKVIFRADDVGYTNTHNDGTFKAIEEGVITSCDLMMDCPGFEDACARLKNYPWISVGWHTHFWGRPVLDCSQVPSMVDRYGRFKWRKNKSLVSEVDYEEAVKECRAQIERCEKLLGRVPDTAGFDCGTPLGRAIQTVCDEYHILYDFLEGETPGGKILKPSEKYKDLHLSEFSFHSIPEADDITKIHVTDFPNYDPVKAILMMPIDESRIYFRALHPGYLDDYVIAETSCTVQRVKDVNAFCDERLKRWVRDNRIELINFRDALYGTHEYQNHLRATGSSLVFNENTDK